MQSNTQPQDASTDTFSPAKTAGTVTQTGTAVGPIRNPSATPDPRVGPLRSHKVPDMPPTPSPTPDAAPIVAHQENLCVGSAFLGPGRRHVGPLQAGPVVPLLALPKSAPTHPAPLSLAGALSQVPKAGRAAKAAALVAKASKRNPVHQAPADLEPGAYAPLVKTPGSPRATATRQAMKAAEEAAQALAATLAGPDADGPTKARAKKAALAHLSGVVIRVRVHGSMEATTTGPTLGNIDQDGPLAMALRPTDGTAHAWAQARVAPKAATVEGRHHLGRVAPAMRNPGAVTLADLTA